jgi:hypothetical protein
MLRTILCVVALASLFAVRGAAQGFDYASPDEKSAPTPDGKLDYTKDFVFFPGPTIFKQRELTPTDCEACVQNWLAQMSPIVRQELISNLLFGIHPLMAFLPTDQLVDMPCDHPRAEARHFQLFPVVLEVVDTKGQVGVDFNLEVHQDTEEPVLFRIDRQPTYELKSNVFGVTCPYLVVRNAKCCPPAYEPPAVLENLELLLRADRLLHLGEGLSHAGRRVEAMDCFQQVRALVPGTTLEQRAYEASSGLLAMGLSDDAPRAEEQSEPEKPTVAPEPSVIEEPSGNIEKPGTDFATVHRETKKEVAQPASQCCDSKPHTIVYPVADLLGKGKETRHEDIDELTAVIVNTVEPQTWVENGGQGAIDFYYRSRALVIRQTPAVQEQVADLLSALRRAKPESDSPKEKHHSSAPVAVREKKGACEDECCEDCCENDCCAKQHIAGKCCDSCGESAVLTLPKAACGECNGCRDLQLYIEGCTQEGSATLDPSHCEAFGICVDAEGGADGPRLRWQLPIGPLVVLVQFDRHELKVGVGLVAGDDSTENCEEPR